MAVQQLTQPILNPIDAFDANKVETITFVVIGGAQVIGNRLIISDNETGQQVYNKIQSTMKLEHTLPAGTLANGKYYNAIIRTIDNSQAESASSIAVPFYCYTQPVLNIDNIPASETIENGTYKFEGNYLQQEGEALNSYQFTLYNSNKEILSQTPLIYYETDNSLAYAFVGMSNDTSYYVSLTGETVNGTKITSGLKYFTVRYLQPASFAICDLVNDCDNGFIQISSNIVAIDGKSNPEPPIYIDNKEVDLRDPDSWVRWDEGFDIKNDFTMRVWGRDFNPYENIITLSNNLNTDANPNKIEMKWMIGDVIKELPTYTDEDGYNVNLENSKVSSLENLSIKGETKQKVETARIINEGEGYVTLNPADGKNLYDYNNVFRFGGYQNLGTIKKNGDGWVTSTIDNSTGTFNGFVYDYTYPNLKLEPNTEYTIVIEVKNASFENGGGLEVVNGFVTETQFSGFFSISDTTTNKVYTRRMTTKTNYSDDIKTMLGTQVSSPIGSKISITYRISVVKEDVNENTFSYQPFGYIPSNDFYRNISIMPSGNSVKATRSGYNLLNTTSTSTTVSGVTININEDKSITINGTNSTSTTVYYRLAPDFVLPAGNYTLSNGNPNVSNTTFIFYDDNNNIPRKNISNVTFTEDVLIKPYIKITYGTTVINQTVYPMILSGTYTENTLPQYEQYGAMPSPDYPSPIRNIGDNINLFNKNDNFRTNGVNVKVLDTGIRLVSVQDTRYGYANTVLGKSELLGKTVVAYSDLSTTEGVTPNISLYFGTDSAPTSGGIINKINKESQNAGLWNIPSEFPSGSDTIRICIYIGGENPAPIGATIDYNNLKVEIGDTPTGYSDYNTGSLKTIISNENLGNSEQLYNDMYSFSPKNVRKETIDGKNCIVFTNSSYRLATGFKGLQGKYKENTRYVIRAKARVYDKTLKDSYALFIQAHSKDGKLIGSDSHNANEGNWIQFSFLTNLDSSLEYIDFSYGNTAIWCLDMDSLEIYEGVSVRQVPKSQDTQIVFPFVENQFLYSGSELTINGIYNTRNKLIMDGTIAGSVSSVNVRTDTGNTTFVIPQAIVPDVHKITNYKTEDNIPLLCSQLKKASVAEIPAYAKFNNQIGYWADSSAGFVVGMETSKIGSTKDSVLEYFKNNPMIIEYVTNSPYTTKYTDSQSKAFKELFTAQTYLGQNNIFNDGGIPAPLAIKTVERPTPITPAPIYPLGDKRNLVNIPDFNIYYEQMYHQDTKTDFILKPNYTYTLSFDYHVYETSTDLYLSVGYGKDSYEQDIEFVQYLNITEGRNKLTFTVPKDIPANSNLWIRFANTLIPANVSIFIQNIQLENGQIAKDYKSPDTYTIYPTVSGKNIFNYDDTLYLIQNNITYSGLQNGYSIKPTSIEGKSSLVVGYKGILNQGDNYCISYQKDGAFKDFKLYLTEKESQLPIKEIEITNGLFTVDEDLYDLQLEFIVDNSSLSNILEIWNIQIEVNNKVTDYEIYQSNSSEIDLNKPLNGFSSRKDLICLNSPNILDPNTQSANVEGNTTYYLDQNTNTTYYIWYYNSEGKLITFIDPEGHEASGATGEYGAFTTHKDCVKIMMTKTSDADVHDLTSQEILTNEVMISKGGNAQLYYPYLEKPSLIRNMGYWEFDGTENWTKRANTNNSFQLSTKIIISGICSHYDVFSAPGEIDTKNGIYLSVSASIIITDMRYDTLDKFKAFLAEQKLNDTPVRVSAIMGVRETSDLNDSQIEALSSLSTYELISNVFTDNQIVGESNFSYVSDITDQQTENAYVQLKCYNMNNIPYYIHSNYIDIPEDKSKVFIWLRRKNNLFDLKIEDLGDYSGEEPGDKNKPIVTLDIDTDDVTSTEIPVVAHSIDETGLKTVRFSKNNGESWDEVVTVDGLSSTNSYTFEGLTPNTTYTIRVEAIDISGNIGGISQQVTTKAV